MIQDDGGTRTRIEQRRQQPRERTTQRIGKTKTFPFTQHVAVKSALARHHDQATGELTLECRAIDKSSNSYYQH